MWNLKQIIRRDPNSSSRDATDKEAKEAAARVVLKHKKLLERLGKE